MMNYKFRTILFAIVFLGMMSCDEDLPPSIKINKEIFSVDEQKELGDIFVEKYLDNKSKVLDKNIYKSQYQYIESFNLFVTEQVSRREIFDWDISIVFDDETKNIFCFPGGHIYITTGLLKFIKNESELVGIIANEIYYSESDILVNKLVRHFGGVAMGDVFLGREPEKYSSQEITEYLTNVKFDMRDVLLADELGLEIVCNFEYHPMSISTFIEDAVLVGEDFEWLDRYPTSDERIFEIISVVEKNECTGLLLYDERYLDFLTTLP